MELMNEIQYSTVTRQEVNVRKSLEFRDSVCLNNGAFFFLIFTFGNHGRSVRNEILKGKKHLFVSML